MQGAFDSIPIILILVAGIAAPVAGWYATLRARNSCHLVRARRTDRPDRPRCARRGAARQMSDM